MEGKTMDVHHDGAPVHSSLLVRYFLTKTDTTVIPHTPYSLHLAPADFFPVPQPEIHLESTKICHHRQKRKFAEGPEGDTKRSVPGLFPKLEETLGAVY
jgi:hypothetical protein